MANLHETEVRPWQIDADVTENPVFSPEYMKEQIGNLMDFLEMPLMDVEIISAIPLPARDWGTMYIARLYRSGEGEDDVDEWITDNRIVDALSEKFQDMSGRRKEKHPNLEENISLIREEAHDPFLWNVNWNPRKDH